MFKVCLCVFQTELPKTTEEFEERLIVKSFFLKSMNAFAPIFYVAFFKGRYARVFLPVFHLSCPSAVPTLICSPCSSVFPLFRFAGRPGDYVYVFGDYRMEEVCLISLISGCFVQVSTVNVVLPLANICPFT